MRFTDEQLKAIYDRSSGYCHLCHKKLAFKNYGQHGARGAWEVEHSVPRAAGGTDRFNNLYPACISCNRSKGKRSTKSVRAENGVSKAPVSATKRREAKAENAVTGAFLGGVVGAMTGGPIGAAIGAVIGASVAKKSNPDNN